MIVRRQLPMQAAKQIIMFCNKVYVVHISLCTVLYTILAAGKQTEAGVEAIYISAEGEDKSTNGRWWRGSLV